MAGLIRETSFPVRSG
jgi:hypothetical protein